MDVVGCDATNDPEFEKLYGFEEQVAAGAALVMLWSGHDGFDKNGSVRDLPSPTYKVDLDELTKHLRCWRYCIIIGPGSARCWGLSPRFGEIMSMYMRYLDLRTAPRVDPSTVNEKLGKLAKIAATSPQSSTALYGGHARRQSYGTQWARSSRSCRHNLEELRRRERGRRSPPRAMGIPAKKRAALEFAFRLAKMLSNLSSLRRPTRTERTIPPSAQREKRDRIRRTTISTPKTTSGRPFGAQFLGASDNFRSHRPVTSRMLRFRLMLDLGLWGPFPLGEIVEYHQGEDAAERIQVCFDVVLASAAL